MFSPVIVKYICPVLSDQFFKGIANVTMILFSGSVSIPVKILNDESVKYLVLLLAIMGGLVFDFDFENSITLGYII